jgi:hypothetical protein
MGFYPGKIKLERKMPACPDVIPWIKKKGPENFPRPLLLFLEAASGFEPENNGFAGRF